MGGHRGMDVRFKVSVKACGSLYSVNAHEVGILGVYRILFFFSFTDGLKEQPSLMDYFQLRIQVSHPASTVITDPVHAV